MSLRAFPIRTATSCQLKWNWSTLYLHQARTASCHRTAWSDFSSETFDSFHNTPIKIQDRESMLAGQWPEHSCSYCKNIEQAGGTSDRHIHIDHPNQVPVELEVDPTATQVTPSILEVYFNNTCNLGCLYCIPELSSKINQENNKFGKFDSQGVVLEPITIHNQHSEIVEKFWQWMQANSQSLARLHVLGGEPFYQSEFDRCLDYFDRVAHPVLELNIVTNLMIDHNKLDNYIKKFKELLSKKHLKRVDITCSIDCTGPEQEFVRWGMNMDRWLHNFDMLMQHKWLTLNINQTISVLTIKTMPTLMNWLATWRQSRPIGHFFSVVSPQPSYMDPAILGAGVFDHEFESVLSLMPDDVGKQYMSGIFKAIQSSSKNPAEMLKLKTFLNEKDQRRGTDWKQVFPWLAKELEHVV